MRTIIKHKYMFVSIVAASVFAVLFSLNAHAHVAGQEKVWRAKVIKVVEEKEEEIPGTETTSLYQKLTAEIIEGPQKGDIVIVEDNFITLSEGDTFFLSALEVEGETVYGVHDYDRTNILLAFLVIFVVAVLWLGRLHGLRSLLSLFGSLIVVLYVLLPGILKGFPPVLLSTVLAVLILVIAIYATHGVNRKSNAALAGTITSILFTIVLAWGAVDLAHLTGFTDDAASFLNFRTQGELDFSGLLLGAIIIGVLGVLDDIAVTQASAVNELSQAAPESSAKEVYQRAMQIGREHVGALVNTLALAYVGVALPLLLLFYTSESSTILILNREIFATEILRTLVGSIGIVFAVPITTLFAIWLLKGKGENKLDNS